ncbi:type 3 dihydrofolate reductase [Alteromonas sp. a30]|uniref:type 3 dihydrofolate reductase n=1 Tax=Alteromonas sp. a30 TaxID=2730917 RepID=UPI00227E561D|nr:type 3 dihydrofolate reductase [Alteromonas sp. a30]MCY7294447.1 type 3 dihydrofolate reductase [Alteromonas sp. a30]
MIAAMANNRVIGNDNAMPWHLPADLKHFKATTLGKPVVMGRKTYESIGKALPKRRNIVVSGSGFSAPDADIVSSAEEALLIVPDEPEIMIIGGGNIYAQFLPVASRLYLTFIDLEVNGDTCFPDYAAEAAWAVLEEELHSADDANPYNYRFVTLERV